MTTDLLQGGVGGSCPLSQTPVALYYADMRYVVAHPIQPFHIISLLYVESVCNFWRDGDL